jgi:hypothetical protein
MNWNQRPGYSLYVDEFQHFATADFAELYKEARKFGARITVAHQDRQDLTPENRSATLTASTFVAFQPIPVDAAEIAPLFFDTEEPLRPEHIYSDPLRYLRLHEEDDIQDFCKKYVLPLQKRNEKQANNALEVLQDLLYQSVKTQRISGRFFKAYTQQMFPLLQVTFEQPMRKQKQIQTTLQQQQQDIAILTSFLTSDQTFEDYLNIYYKHYLIFYSKRSVEWYYRPWVPEDYLLADTEFWNELLCKTPYPIMKSRSYPYERKEYLKKAMNDLQEEAAENEKLHHRDTFEKVIAELRKDSLTQRRYILNDLRIAIAEVHKLKSEYAINLAIQLYHSDANKYYRTTTLKSIKDAVFWQPVGSRKKPGIINEATRKEELVAQPLALEKETSREQILAWLPDQARLGQEPSQKRVAAAWEWACRCYTKLRQIDLFLADKTALLKSYYTEMGQYAKYYGLWEHLNNEQVDSNVWQALDNELRRNMLLGQRNTVEKLIQLRKDGLRKQINLLLEEAEAYKAMVPNIERGIEEEIAMIEQKRKAFCTYMEYILELLIEDPGPLGERRVPKESDTREKLLNLQKRQALVRITGDIDQKPQKYTMQTLDVPQVARKDEVERWFRQIRDQTETKYCRPRSQVEQELRYTPEIFPEEDGKPVQDEGLPNSWYEE